MKRILFVDDEHPVLEAMKKGAATRADAGAIVTDALMPNIDGERVLRAAQQLQPTAIRIMLSGQVEHSGGHKLAAVAHPFFSKPSSVTAILGAIEEACRVRDSAGGGAAGAADRARGLAHRWRAAGARCLDRRRAAGHTPGVVLTAFMLKRLGDAPLDAAAEILVDAPVRQASVA